MYAKIFSQIFDSSIADDYELRHFFMDMIVLADQDGNVDMTLSALAARTRIPIEKVTQFIQKLSEADNQSRTPDYNGARIVKLDEHRNWGWLIVNYEQFRGTFNEKDRRQKAKTRIARFRERQTQLLVNQEGNACLENVTLPYASVVASEKDGIVKGRFVKPTVEAVKLHAIKIELPEREAEKFFDYYEANGWRVGRNPMKLWTAALANWKRNWKEFSGQRGNNQPQLNKSDLANPWPDLT